MLKIYGFGRGGGGGGGGGGKGGGEGGGGLILTRSLQTGTLIDSSIRKSQCVASSLRQSRRGYALNSKLARLHIHSFMASMGLGLTRV